MTDIRELLNGIEDRAKDAGRHVSLCGPCDGGLPMACTCATVDPRETISELIAAVREQNAALRAVLNRHGRRPCKGCTDEDACTGICVKCGSLYPCADVRAITEALGGAK